MRPTDGEIRSFLEEVAIEGYEPDDEIVRLVADALVRDHPGAPDVEARVQRLAPEVFDELHAREAAWPIPTDNDRLDRAFAELDRRGVLTRQNFYTSEVAAREEMSHEILAARRHRAIHGFAYFWGGDTRRALAGGGLRITWGAALPRSTPAKKLERASWAVAQEIHAALWAQGLSPSWDQAVGSPIELPFTWRRRRKRGRSCLQTRATW